MMNNSNPKWDMRNQTSRKEAIKDPEGGPGTYEERRNWDDNARVHEFGQRREQPIPNGPGPGTYDEHVTKMMENNSNPKWDMRNQTGRQDAIGDPEGGPGTYEERRNWDDDARVHEFG
jgi:hypothetical protein